MAAIITHKWSKLWWRFEIWDLVLRLLWIAIKNAQQSPDFPESKYLEFEWDDADLFCNLLKNIRAAEWTAHYGEIVLHLKANLMFLPSLYSKTPVFQNGTIGNCNFQPMHRALWKVRLCNIWYGGTICRLHLAWVVYPVLIYHIHFALLGYLFMWCFQQQSKTPEPSMVFYLWHWKYQPVVLLEHVTPGAQVKHTVPIDQWCCNDTMLLVSLPITSRVLFADFWNQGQDGPSSTKHGMKLLVPQPPGAWQMRWSTLATLSFNTADTSSHHIKLKQLFTVYDKIMLTELQNDTNIL